MAAKLTGLHAKFTGDSKSFVRAAQQSAFELNKVNAKLSEQKANAAAAAASSEGLAKSMHKLRMETDGAYAGMNRFQRASELVKKVAESQKWSQEQLGAELQRLANHYGVAEAAGMSMGDQLKSARFHAANLTAQFNDIGVMLAAGQNPLMLAIQQGTQISQVMQAAGGSTRQMGSLLIQSFKAMISPTTLLTLGLIAGGAALIQWAMSALSAGEETKTFDDVMGEFSSTLSHVKSITDTLKMSNTELQDQFGKMSVEARNAAVRMLELEQSMADRKLANSIIASSDAFSQLIPRMDSWLLGGAAMLVDTISLSREFNITARQVVQLSEAFATLQAATSLEDRVKALENLRAVMAELNISTEQLPVDVQTALLEAEKLTSQAMELKTALEQATDAAPKAGYLAGAIRDMDVMYQRALDIIRLNKEIAATQKIASAYSEYYGSRKAAPSLPVTTGNFISMPLNEAGFPTADSLMPPPPKEPDKGSKKQGIDYESELEQLSKSLMSKEQLELDSYNRRQELLQASLEKKLLTQEQYAGMMEQVEAAHNFEMLKQQNDNVSSTLGALGQLFQGSKQIGAAIALTNSYLAFTEVLKDPSYIGRPFARFAAAAAALSSGLAAVRSIKSAQPGGSASGGISGGGGAASGGGSAGGAKTSTAVSLQLVGGDMYSRDQVLQLINAINAATADGAQIMLR